MDGCEMQIQEVNWQRVVENWKLPVKIDKKNPRNPYRMGDCHRDLCGQGLGFSRVDRPATAGPDPDAHLKHSLAGVLNAMQPRGPLSGGRPDHRAEGRDHRVPAETIERRREAVGILDELKAAGLIDYSLGADRADGTGPQLDVWTTRDTLLARTPAPSSLSKRAKTMWAMLLLGGLGSGGRNGK
jgi:hypothetical protein